VGALLNPNFFQILEILKAENKDRLLSTGLTIRNRIIGKMVDDIMYR